MVNELHEYMQYGIMRWGRLNEWECVMHDQAERDRAINKFIPDVSMRYRGKRKDRHSTVYVECQDGGIDEGWMAKIRKNYEGMTVIIFDLDRIEKHINEKELLGIRDYLRVLDQFIEFQMEGETYKFNKNVPEEQFIDCPKCGDRIRRHNLKSHLGKHWREERKTISRRKENVGS